MVCLGMMMLGGHAIAQKSKPRREYVEWRMEPTSATWRYGVGERAEAELSIRLGGEKADSLWVRYETGDEMMPATRKDSVMLKNGMVRIDMGTREEPGFRACKIRFTVAGREYTDMVKVGYDIGDIRAYTTEPADFDKFWRQTIRDARKIDMAPVVKRLEEKSTDKINVYKVRLTVGQNDRHIYGYLSIPRDGERHPVILCPPGAGVKMDDYNSSFSEQGYIYMSIEIHGMDPECTDEERKATRERLNNYQSFGVESRETYYYKDVYAACVRSIDYLTSLKEFDGKNVGVTGGSQGGALTIVTAALHDKVTFLAAFYPALSDLTGFKYGRAGGWPKFFSPKFYGPKDMQIDSDRAVETLGYYDVVNFTKRLSVPGFYNYGFMDETCSPTSVSAVINSIAAEKHIVTTPTSGHWRFTETMTTAMEWMKKQCK